jgi:hypothetical protein
MKIRSAGSIRTSAIAKMLLAAFAFDCHGTQVDPLSANR